MSLDLAALVVALALGAAVVGLGSRRNLAETTRRGLPRFGDQGQGEEATLGLYEGKETARRPLSSAGRHWLAGLYLLLAAAVTIDAVLSSDDVLFRFGLSALSALYAVALLVRAPRTEQLS